MISLNDLETKIGYTFRNKNLLLTAVTHSSLANEKNCESYERLEFLGDSILGYTAAEYLYLQQPNLPEGKMTRMRAKLVCEDNLCIVAEKLNMGSFMRISHGAEKTGMRNLNSVMADMVESVIAAIYLDAGMKEAKRFIYDKLLNDAELNSGSHFFDYKSALQELAQKDGPVEIKYVLNDESGPDHDKTFYYSVSINGCLVGTGNGKTKKEAEQAAARMALSFLQETNDER